MPSSLRQCAVVLASVACAAFAQTPPVTPKKPHATQIHGETRIDDYFWLRDSKDPEVVAHLDAENAYTDAS